MRICLIMLNGQVSKRLPRDSIKCPCARRLGKMEGKLSQDIWVSLRLAMRTWRDGEYQHFLIKLC